VPFDFLRRRRGEAATASEVAARGPTTSIAFDGMTEEWRLVGRMEVPGRLSDVLNKREAIPISEVSWAPIDGSDGFTAVPGLKSVDPYDLILVLAGEASLPPLSDAEKAAHKVHKIAYDVALEAPPYRVVGTVFLYPGSEPLRLLDRATEMFVPVVDAVAWLGDRRVSDPDVDTILVNRFYLRGVEQVDKRTGERHQKLPGAPLGGVSWQDRSR
jgi:hypothetical protein